jgi:voltage-gated potassium channel Kch
MKFSADSILNAFRSLRFMQLFVFSLVVLLLQAIFHQWPFMYLVIGVLYLNALLVALSVSGSGATAPWMLIVLWILSLITRLFVPAGLDTLFLVLSKGMAAALLVVAIIHISHYIVTSHRVTANALFAAVVVYILMALLFAQLYSIIQILLPGSFSFPTHLTDFEGRIADIAFNYYSFVTIATLGYGDITPRYPLAQMLSSIEAVIGQFYVAIVVAWLVSLFVADKRETRG